MQGWRSKVLKISFCMYLIFTGLVKYGNMDGLFLVRESSFSSSSFVLSLYSKGTFFHFQINEIKASHFSIDEGPTIHGKVWFSLPSVFFNVKWKQYLSQQQIRKYLIVTDEYMYVMSWLSGNMVCFRILLWPMSCYTCMKIELVIFENILDFQDCVIQFSI